jgi:aryl-alcohol dehydrogenase-like predicted oxidoreductase
MHESLVMEFRELGKSGLKISAVGLGTWQWGAREWGWGRQYGRREVMAAFQKALELGINFIDTAEIYGVGKSERIVGEAIQGHRENVVIATKVWPWNLSRGRIIRAADKSKQRLGVDVIDLYQIHWPNPIFPIRNTMKTMKRLVELGKVRCVGISNFNLKKTQAAQEALAPLDLASNQVKYNLLDREIENELLPYTRSANVTIIAYSPLEHSLLTRRYAAEGNPTSLVQAANPRFSSRNRRRLEHLQATISSIANAHGKTPAQTALNWLIAKPNVVAIPGTKRPEHVVDSAGAAGWRLTESETEALESAALGVVFDRFSGIPNLLRGLVSEVIPTKYAAAHRRFGS